MRIRQYPAIGFVFLVFASAYLGLAPRIESLTPYKQSDKVLHFVTFFLLTLCFYWIIETNRRRNLQLAIFVCPILLGVGSEIVQGLLPNGRQFDPYDILANILGSIPALLINTWYHKRMLERKRLSKSYTLVSGDGDDELDLELGEEIGTQEEGVIREPGPTGHGAGSLTLEQEVDNWDENAEDWEEDEVDVSTATEGEGVTPATSGDEAVKNKGREKAKD